MDLEFASNADHVTLMSVVSACGKRCNPVVVLPDACQKYRTKKVAVEMPHKFLPHGSIVIYRTPASMTVSIFEK